MLVVLLASCVSWPSVKPNELAGTRREPVFVVTPAEAFEMRVQSSDEAMLSGDVIHAWTIPTPEGELRPNEAPFDMANRLRWTPQHTIPEYVHVPISSVRYASKQTYWNENTKAIFAVGTIAFIVLAVAVGESLASINDTGNE
jgi:hypothetical protein